MPYFTSTGLVAFASLFSLGACVEPYPRAIKVTTPVADNPVAGLRPNVPPSSILGLPKSKVLPPDTASGLALANKVLAQLPRLTATITQSFPGENVTIEMKNTNNNALYILPDYSFLTPGIETQVMNLTDATGKNLPPRQAFRIQVQPAETMSTGNIAGLKKLDVGESLSRSLNLSQVFAVPSPGAYQLSLQSTIIGASSPDPAAWTDISTYVVKIDSQTFEASLTASPSAGAGSSTTERRSPQDRNQKANHRTRNANLAARDSWTAVWNANDVITGCSPEDRALVAKMIGEASAMADAALRDTKYEWLRNLYFGDTWRLSGGTNAWSRILAGIAQYNVSAHAQPGAALTWVCDRSNAIEPCADSGFFSSMTVYAHETELQATPVRDVIVLCKPFFDLPEYNNWFPSKFWYGEQPSDQPTIMLHEMTHTSGALSIPEPGASQGLGTTDVPDKSWYSWALSAGLDDVGCYRYSCCVELASSPWDGHSPTENAQNFAFYAKSVRDCNNGIPALACVF